MGFRQYRMEDHVTSAPSTETSVAALVLKARRILVIGCSGSGKSTLSRKISDLCNLPYVSMDRDFFWLEGWVQRDRAEQRSLIEHAVAKERWIMDGTAPSSFDVRVPRADLILWVRLPRTVSLVAAIKRIATTYGRTRPEMAPGCPERFDLEFMRYIWTFEKNMVPKIEKALADTNIHVPIVTLKSFQDSDRLVADLILEKHRNADIRNDPPQPSFRRADV